MACETKQRLEPSSVAAPPAVGPGRLNFKDTSPSDARPVGSSPTRSEAATTQFDAVSSGEEFNFQGIDDEAQLSDPPPPNPPPQGTSFQQDDALVSVMSKGALDIMYFFTGVKPAEGGVILKQDPSPKVCKLCSEKYDTDKSTCPEGVPNYIYSPYTANGSLRRHLHQVHANEYDDAVLRYKWTYKLSTESSSFSPAAFLEHPVASAQ